MKTLFLKENTAYTGPQLRSLYLYEKGVRGDGMISWVGPCDVQTTDLVDAEDRVQNDFIKSKEMVHFLAEFFHKDVFFGICMQRLMAEIVIDVLSEQTSEKFERRGDDIYCQNKKLNVSIATVSSVSTLVHFGVNVDPKGAPVAACGLQELKVDPAAFAEQSLKRIQKEVVGVYDASMKVFSV